MGSKKSALKTEKKKEVTAKKNRQARSEAMYFYVPKFWHAQYIAITHNAYKIPKLALKSLRVTS